MADAKKSEAEGKVNPVPVQPGTPEQQPNSPAIKPRTGQPAPPKESDQASPLEGIPVWTIVWTVLILVVFGVLWGTGKIEAIKKYLHETREQLRKATWPTGQELKQHIVVVLLSSVLLAVFTVAADFVVREIIWGAMLNGDSLLFDKTTTQ
tara:strand:- start:70 stop:522 length:453 start_codon:yes stop_codon:yes gene_type:complete